MGTELHAGWRIARLPDVIDFKEGPGILARDFALGGVPLIRLAGITGTSLLDGCNYLDPKKVEVKWSHFRLSEGDTVLSTSASLGRVARVTEEAAGAIPYTGIIRMRPATNEIDRDYIQFILADPAFQSQVVAMGSGSVMQHFGPSHLRAMTVRIPPLVEQRGIVELLGALGEKIESNARVANDQLRVSRTWFEHLASEAPRERLDSMIDLIRSTVHPGTSPDDAFEHFSIPAFDQGSTPTLDYGRDLKSGKTGLAEGEVSVLLSKLNPNHAWRCWWALPSGVGQAVCSPEFVAMTAKTVPPEWLFAAIAWDGGLRRDILSGLSGTTGSRQRVKPSDVAAAEAPVFDESSASEWLALARPAFEQIERCRVESRRLAAIRDALLPRLVSGRIRVPLTEDAAEAVETVLDAA